MHGVTQKMVIEEVAVTYKGGSSGSAGGRCSSGASASAKHEARRASERGGS